ncbi:GGDEF domain-containing protein [Deinococcus arcticus]|uniref:GGDEF domain-containing protein n=1 Tax=Deinococcus arcticus TaxID=2136176 RepID=A0A2T3W5W7_9DEIO|nr:GGDEF domain-containing protein [Deinococcus arcticus]
MAEAQAAQDQISEDAQRHLNVELRQAQADASSWQDRLRCAEVEARQDPLTGVLNRRGLEEGLRALQDGGGPGWSLLAALFVDIDHFKSVNDRFSHAHGDRVLQAVAGLLSGTVRAGTLLGRYGGEEFVLVAPIRAPGQAHDLAERCRRAIEAHDWSGLLPGVGLSASVGYAVERPGRLSLALQAADDHLYRAKAAGRNRVHPPA